MLNILVNAYACSPNMGSEPGMAWNWCINLAKFCKLHIITEGEFKDKIESILPNLPQGKNMHFYYNSVSQEVRKMCWNQGDWRFYKYYKDWQYDTYKIALDIIASNRIDIIHQLNMIGFREPGYLWKIDGVPFVWGPIGGLKQFPIAYLKDASLKMRLFNYIKNFINVSQLKFDGRVNSALKNARFLISSIPDSYHALKRYKNLESVIIPETGCFLHEGGSVDRFEEKEFHIIWVGKFDFRKQLPLALESIAYAKNKNVRLHVYGTGATDEIKHLRGLAKDLSIEKQIVWYGSQPNDIIHGAMRKAHLFFFTSVNEDTSTVVLEAISNNLPILCFDACGFGPLVSEHIGRKIKLSTPSQSVKEFAEEINKLEANRSILKDYAINCQSHKLKLSWEEKAQKVYKLYLQCLQ